jgi:hypothetical protein
MANGFFCFGTPQANYLIQLGVRIQEQILVRNNAVVDNAKLRQVYTIRRGPVGRQNRMS